MAVELLFLHALTSIHPGTGQGVGTIDLPIARERATNLPVAPGSSIKGSLRAEHRRAQPDDDNLDYLFGKEDRQGQLKISDARLLLLPVRCPGTTFCWVTSPYVLRRFRRDCTLLNAAAALPQIPSPNDGTAMLAGNEATVQTSGKARLVLEDLDFDADTQGGLEWAQWIGDRLFPGEADWKRELTRRFAIISDSNFDYLCEFATEVTAHIKIDEVTGTVAPGALWYEETLPAETVLVSVVQSSGTGGIKLPKTLVIGGNETTGQGLVRLVATGGGAK